ncbi:MAG: hypothetical protein JRH15_22240, partial [Deltaproteobacteria bacterium]|nr:hypothetical protein [Deltaproteobacteria bacterium]
LFGMKKRFPAAAQMIAASKGKLAKDVRRYTAGSFYMQLVNATGMCMFGAITSVLPLVEWINGATGWDLSPDEYLKTGERILSLRKAFNAREKIRQEDHRLCDRALGKTPFTKGPLKGKTVDMERLMQEFYDTVGWDMATGGPTPEKMEALGLEAFLTEKKA